MRTLLTAQTLFTPTQRIEQPFVLIDGDAIADFGSRKSRELPRAESVIELGDSVLAPGLIDMHNHGGAGRDVMEQSQEALPTIERLLATHGVTSYFPTTITAPREVTLRALERLANSIENASTDAGRARPIGIHMEGPFLSHARRGVHPPENLMKPTLEAFDEFWQAARGHIRVMTIAPEVDGALEVIRAAVKRGVCVSLGHSDAGLDAARAGVEAGARHATHTFNAMRPLAHRDPGILTQVLIDDRVSADIIADGLHVDPAVVKLFFRQKGPERTVLITDSTAATGMPPGKFHMGDFEFEVKDGKCLANGVLAGSTLTLDRAVRNVMAFANVDLQTALRAATANPASATALPGRGTISTGCTADLVVLAPSGELRKTMIAGKLIS